MQEAGRRSVAPAASISRHLGEVWVRGTAGSDVPSPERCPRPAGRTRNARLPLEKLPPGSELGTPRSSAVSAVWFTVRLMLSQEKSDRS